MIDDLPNFFGWGRGGLPGEFRSLLTSEDMSARIERGEDVRGPQTIDFAEDGVNRIALRLLKRLRDERERYPKLSHEIASWCYLLHAYCAACGRPAPPSLLWLTFEALGLKERRPDPAIQKELGTPKVEKIDAFLQAAALDGEADACGTELSVNNLANLVGVERKTIRTWREDKSYISRRRFVAWRETAD